MSLRRKTFLILLGIYLFYALLNTTVFRIVVYPSFRDLQERAARHSMEFWQRAIEDECDTLGRLADDYASRDDTYAFVDQPNQRYVDGNFSETMLRDNGLEFVGIFNTSGVARIAMGFDRVRDAATNFPGLTPDAFGAGHPLLAHDSADSTIDGLYRAEAGLFLVASRPVLTGNDKGPVRGTLIMARIVDRHFESRFAGRVDEKTHFLSPDAAAPPDQQVVPVTPQAPDREMRMAQVSEDELDCRLVLNDIEGKPVAQLRLLLPRTIAKRAERVGRTATASVLLGGLLFVLAALVLLETCVLSRVRDLERSVARIATTKDLSTRLPIDRNDELSRLTGGINIMLAALEQSEDQLRHSEERYRTLFESSNDAIFLLQGDRFTDCNPRALTVLGAERDMVVGYSPERFLPTHQPNGGRSSDLMGERTRRASSGMAQFFEWQFTRHDGTLFDAEINLSRLGLRGSSYLLMVVRDVTDRKQAEQRYRALFREMLSGFALHEIVCDEHGKPCDYRFLEVNPAFEKQTGLRADDVIGKLASETIPNMEPYWIETYGEVALTGNAAYFQHYAEPLGRYFEVAAFSPGKGQFATVFRDVTERKRAEEERRRLSAKFQQAQKLESLGVLAGGIAHDFNNLLVGILGNADLAMDDVPADSPARQTLVGISDAAKRAAELCRQMLAYSGRGRLTIGPMDISRLVADMTRLLEISVAKNVVLKFDLAEGIPLIQGDSAQTRQIVMSLVTNASEAIGKKSGIVSVTTGSTVCDADYLAGAYVDDGLSPGIYTFIEVTDTGCGMDKETMAQIFDPFYTTKFIGRGLGLATVLGMVRGHKGAIRVDSTEREGSTFRVLFPTVEHVMAEKPEEDANKPEDVSHGTVLLADDDETVRAVGKRILEKMGLTVLLAEDGREALRLFKECPHDIVCVILDLTMPHLGGEETLRKLRLLSPDLPIIISSGYDEEDVVARFAADELAGFIQKPYQATEMTSSVRRAIG